MGSRDQTTTVLYKNNECIVLCSLRLSHRTGNDPAVLIVSPRNVVKNIFVKIQSTTTLHHFVIHSIRDGSLVDYINSIAMCMIKANIPCEISVAALFQESIMVYSPESNKVEYLYTENLNTNETLDCLKKLCIESYKQILESL